MPKEESLEKKEIWVLGSQTYYKGTDKQVEWNSDYPNFVDCDILIIDLTTLDGTIYKSNQNRLFNEQINISEMAKFGGTLICITSPSISIKRYDHWIDNYDWLPVIPQINKLTPGTKIKLEENVFSSGYYKKFVKKWTFEITELKFGRPYPSNHSFIQNSKAKTRAEKMIGFSIKYDDGIIHLLPPPSEVQSYGAISYLIEEIRKAEKEKQKELLSIPPNPSWMTKYFCEEERITTEEKSKLSRKLKETDNKLKTFNEINRIVWVCGDVNKGKTLENAIKTLFEKDFSLIIEKTPPGAHVDLKGTTRDNKMKFAFEVTGVKKAVTKQTNKVGQTTNYYYEKEDDNEKIVLIANTYCDKELDSRPISPTDNFSDYVINPLKSMKVCMITTFKLYNLWKDMKNGKITKEEILKEIFEADGVFK